MCVGGGKIFTVFTSLLQRGKMYFSARNIHKSWESKTIQFGLECEKGTMTCLLGPSGSGKSTVLNIIAGLEQNDKDFSLELFLDGQFIQNLPPAQRGVGMVFQSGALFNHLNVVDNVAYGLVSAGVKKKEARKLASEYLVHFGLQGFEKRMPQSLSGGEKQRVALARTLIIKPKLVLLDELKEWQKELGFTAIMVTHDEDEAQTVADKIVRMHSEV